MRRVAAALLALFVCWAGVEAKDLAPIPSRLLNCRPPVLARIDNDIQISPDRKPDGRRMALPLAVQSVLNKNTDWITRHAQEDERGLEYWSSCRDIYPFVNLIKAPNGLQLYVVRAVGYTGGNWFLPYIYNPVTKEVGSKAPNIYGKWASPSETSYLKKPYVSFVDFRGDGHFQLVIEEQVHNGNVYNGAIYSYFDVGPHMELTRILALETRVPDPMEKNYGSDYVRNISRQGDGRVRLDLYFRSATQRERLQPMGFVIVKSDGPGSPFHVVERHPVQEQVSPSIAKNDDVLVSFMSSDDDKFLREGYNFYY